MIDQRKIFLVELTCEMGGAHCHADAVGKALAERPVVISTPGVSPYSGWPGVFEPHCRKFWFFERKIVAGQVEQRVDQHRAVAGREQKAIPILPFWVPRVVRRKRVQRTCAIGAAPRSKPGWPEFAF